MGDVSKVKIKDNHLLRQLADTVVKESLKTKVRIRKYEFDNIIDGVNKEIQVSDCCGTPDFNSGSSQVIGCKPFQK